MKRITALVLSAAMLFALSCTKKEAPQVAAPKQPTGKTAATPREKAIALLDESAKYLMKGYKEEDGSLVPKEQGGVGFAAVALTAIARAPKEVRGPHEAKLAKTAAYIASFQKENGGIYDEDLANANYTTSIAVMALVAFDREKYKDVVAKAQKYLVDTQFLDEQLEGADKALAGGWDYDPIDKKRPEKGVKPGADMSNAQFSLEALHVSGLPKDSKTWELAVKFLSRSQNRSESNDIAGIAPDVQPGDDGGFAYSPLETKANEDKPIILENGKKQFVSYASMTYAGLRSFIFANVNKDDARVVAAVNWIRKNYTLDKNAGLAKGKEMEGYYYYLHTFAKSHYVWGEPKFKIADGSTHDWRVELIDKIAGLKLADGSYVNKADRWFENSPFLCTAYVAEALNMAVRSLDEQK